MSVTLGTVEEVAQDVETIARDVSYYAPEPVRSIAVLLEDAAGVIAVVLKAIEAAEAAGVSTDPIVAAINSVQKQASDLEMRQELK